MQRLVGKLCIKIWGADLAHMITQISNQGIILYQIHYCDQMTVIARIEKKDWPVLRQWLDGHGFGWKIEVDKSYTTLLRLLRNRMVIICGIVLLIVLTVVLPQFVLFVDVIGNQTISDHMILDKAHHGGFHLGMKRNDLRSEAFKNAVLDAMPELEWIGIKVKGCTAQIEVKEAQQLNNESKEKGLVGNIVAAVDGVVLSATAESGNLLIYPGQVVHQSQILISGYTDCGQILRVTKPEGEVIAQTIRDITAISPASCRVRLQKTDEKTLYGLRIGKKLIKFYKDSGISCGSCVKMYSEEYWELPGGYQLPIAWITEKTYLYETKEARIPADKMYDVLYAGTCHYIRSQMIAGELIHVQTDFSLTEAYGILSGQCNCRESIGLYTSEENIQSYG